MKEITMYIFILLNVFQSIHEKESFLSQVMFLKYYENNLN